MENEIIEMSNSEEPKVHDKETIDALINNAKSKILKRILIRLHRHNQNYLCIVTGETGSGKSLTSLSLAEKLDPDFDINHVVFSSRAFMELLNSGKIKRGCIVVLDESGVGIGAREYATISNRLMNWYLQSFRSLNVGVFFTLPTMAMLDINVRRLAHAYIETQKIDRKKNMVRLKYLDCQVNSDTGKVYKKYPRVKSEDLRTYILNSIHVGKPSVKLQHEYHKKKQVWLNNLALSTLSGIKGREEEELKETRPNLDSVYEAIMKNKENYESVSHGRKYISKDLVRKEFGLTIAEANILKARLNKEQEKEGNRG